jgi:tRNA U34 5-methylaminomethyl-2-thiouridine-forming methyltransferase MnmC
VKPESPPSRTLTADGSATLYSARYAQLFASEKGALSEARHVFLDGSGAAASLAAGRAVRVLEVGFGTGLNFFVTAQAALAYPGARLKYTALEHTLLPAETVQQLGYRALLGSELVESYLEWRAQLEPTPGSHTFVAGGGEKGEGKGDGVEEDRVRLELLLGDATTQRLPVAAFDTVYHDAFSPEVNAELWTEAFLGILVVALGPGGTLVSYCVQGAVRRRLRALGLAVAKRPGPPGGKREVLFAQKPAAQKPGR